jgi:6-phospho 3-hexuloisomerase
VLSGSDERDVQRLVSIAESAQRIFIAGAGRSALAARFFAMRLMHCGYTVYVVGEIVTPSVAAGDVLVVLSGSGSTETLLALARKGGAAGARIVLVTARPGSPIAALAGAVMLLGADGSAKSRHGMPMGTLFELSALIFLESVIYQIIGHKELTEEHLRARHANLE